MGNPNRIRDIAGLTLLVAGGIGVIVAIIWLLAIDQGVVAMGLVSVLAVEVGWKLARYEVEFEMEVEQLPDDQP